MIERLSKYIKILVLVIVGILSISTYILYQNNKSLESQLDISKSNEKAFVIENSGLKDQNRAFQFTIEQLEYFNDSLITKMNDVRKELKIKDDNLKQMQYLLSELLCPKLLCLILNMLSLLRLSILYCLLLTLSL